MNFEAFVKSDELASNASSSQNENSFEHGFRLISDTPVIVDFIANSGASQDQNDIYSSAQVVNIYRNFLDWLFTSFDCSEDEFRSSLIEKLGLVNGQKCLIVGCGLGEDLTFIAKLVGPSGEIHAQDLNKNMVLEAANSLEHPNFTLSISDACNLPYKSEYFDAVFHFGGINLFSNIGDAISEMTRVCKKGGVVVFGDEGIAEHLRNTDYGKVAIENNPLWEKHPPMHLLPYNAQNIELSYVLENCFYVVKFSPGSEPRMNIDVEHKGLRGGTARSRYYGKLEGIDPKLKAEFLKLAQSDGESVSALLEGLIREHLSTREIS